MRHDDPEFGDKRTHSIGDRRSLANEALPNTMEREYQLLVDRLDRNESHVGSRLERQAA